MNKKSYKALCTFNKIIAKHKKIALMLAIQKITDEIKQ